MTFEETVFHLAIQNYRSVLEELDRKKTEDEAEYEEERLARIRQRDIDKHSFWHRITFGIFLGPADGHAIHGLDDSFSQMDEEFFRRFWQEENARKGLKAAKSGLLRASNSQLGERLILTEEELEVFERFKSDVPQTPYR